VARNAEGAAGVRQGVYWIALIGMFAVLIWDIADKGAQYTTVLFLVFLVIAVWALRFPARSLR
jgi:hypothetical protein